MRFLIITRGHGEGCDYTVGCNVCVDSVEADDCEAAFRLHMQNVYGEGWNDGRLTPDERVESVTVVPAPAPGIDFWPSYIEGRRKYAQHVADVARGAAELAELERLRRKYGDRK